MAVSPLIHIGYHKTGTSWLQARLFNRADLGLAAPFREHEDIYEHLVRPHALDFDPELAQSIFLPGLRETAGRGLVAVLSAERLCGDFFHGGYDSKELADRLARVFPDGKVLIVIREQKSMILSSYKQYVRAGGSCRVRDYLLPDSGARSKIPCDLDHFKYDRLIRHYIGHFGASRVLVLPYEWFREQPADFVRSVLGFAGARGDHMLLENLPYRERDNEALPGVSVALKRRMNHLIRDRLNPWAPLRPPGSKARWLRLLRRLGTWTPAFCNRVLEDRLRATVVEVVGERYRESNLCTARVTGQDLGKFGYDMESPPGA